MSATVLLSPEKLYWAVLAVEPGVLERGGGAIPGSQVTRHTRDLDELMAEFLPVGIETVKPAYAWIDRKHVLGVAAPRELLLAACERETIAALPAAVPAGILPEGLAVPEGITAGLNHLWGDLDPAPVVKTRRLATLTAAAAIVAAAGLGIVGLERRTAALRDAAAAESREVDATLAAAYRKPTREAGIVAMDTELSRLTRTRAPRASAPRDAADALQQLLKAWPRTGEKESKETAKIRTEVLSATADVLTLTVVVEERGDAERLSASLREMMGWKLPQPQFTAAQGGSAVGRGGSAGGGGGGTLSIRLVSDAAANVQVPRVEAVR